jgi:aminopeptidase N
MKKLSTYLIVLLVSLHLIACNQNNDVDAPVVIDSNQQKIDKQEHVKQTERKVSDELTQKRAESRKKRVSNIAYTLDIDLISNPDAYQGQVLIAFDLNSKDQDLTIDFTGGTVSSIEVNGSQVDVDYNGYFVTLSSDSQFVGHNLVSIKYKHPYDQDGTGLHRFVDPVDNNTYLYTYLWPYYSNRLFPNFDQPNLKATYEMTVRAQSDWQVVSSVLEDKIIEDSGSKLWHFPRSKKFSSYIFSLHAGPYQVWEDIADNVPIRLMVRQTLAKYVDVKEWFEFTKMGLEHYKTYFGIAYPFSKYDQVIVPDFNIGAMENVGAVTFAESYVQRGSSSRFQRQRRAGVILHEMAHMWFGDLVTKNWWNGLWLNESFATLMSSIAVSNLPEFKDLWHDFYLNTNLSAIAADKMVSTHPIEVPVASTNDFFAIFDSITYEKGASVLNQLSHYTGQENFRLAVSNYLKEHAWGNTDLNDFVQAQSQQSGLDLTSWANSWLYQSGVNRLKVELSCENEKISHLQIKQFATDNNSILRSQRTQLAFFNSQTPEMKPYFVLPIITTGSITDIPEAKDLTCPYLVYPNYQGWGYTEVELDEKSQVNALNVLNLSQDPMLRSMLWSSLFEASTIDYEQLINTIENEENDRVINQVLKVLIDKINTMERQSKDEFIVINKKLEELLWKQITIGESSISTRIIRLESFINTVRSKDGQDQLIELLEKATTLPELLISQDRRWLIIARLALLSNEKARNFITNEKQSDDTDSGKLAAIKAESSLSDVEIKKRWVSIFLENENPLPLSNQRMAMRNMFPANQIKIQEMLLPELLKALPMIKKTRDNYYQSAYASSLFSGLCSKDALKQLESSLDKDKIGTTLYRFLSENVQKTQDCISDK